MQFVRNSNHLGLTGLSLPQKEEISFSGDNRQAHQVAKGQKFSALFEKEMKKSHPHRSSDSRSSSPFPLHSTSPSFSPLSSSSPLTSSPASLSFGQKGSEKITKENLDPKLLNLHSPKKPKTILEKLRPKNLAKHLKIQDAPMAIKDVPTQKQISKSSVLISEPSKNELSASRTLKKTSIQGPSIQNSRESLDKILNSSRNTGHLRKLEKPFDKEINLTSKTYTLPKNEMAIEQLKDLDSIGSEFTTSFKPDIPRGQSNHLKQFLVNKRPSDVRTK